MHHLRLGLAQFLATGQDVGHRPPDLGGDRPAGIDRLAHRQGPRGAVQVGFQGARRLGIVILGRGRYLRAKPGPRLHIGLVQRTQLGALALQGRIGLVGQGDGVGQGLGLRRRWRAGQHPRRRKGRPSGRPPQSTHYNSPNHFRRPWAGVGD